MKNFIQPGNTITIFSPYDVKSGSMVLAGSIFGVAASDATANDEVEVMLTGVFDLPKVVTENFQVGNLIYLNKTTKLATILSDNNLLIGVAISNSGNPSVTGRIRLNGSFVPGTQTDKRTPSSAGSN